MGYDELSKISGWLTDFSSFRLVRLGGGRSVYLPTNFHNDHRHFMKSLLSFLIALSFFSALSDVLAQPTTEANSTAISFIRQRGLSANIYLLTASSASATTTYKMIQEERGVEIAQKQLNAAMRQIVPKYQPEWDRIMGDIYSKHFSTDELTSLTTLGTKSPFVPKLYAEQNVLGPEMQKALQPLLTSVVTEVVSLAFSTATNLPRN